MQCLNFVGNTISSDVLSFIRMNTVKVGVLTVQRDMEIVKPQSCKLNFGRVLKSFVFETDRIRAKRKRHEIPAAMNADERHFSARVRKSTI